MQQKYESYTYQQRKIIVRLGNLSPHGFKELENENYRNMCFFEEVDHFSYGFIDKSVFLKKYMGTKKISHILLCYRVGSSLTENMIL